MVSQKNKTEVSKMKEYKIRVKSETVTVSEEIYTVYYKMARRERYLEEISVRYNLSYNQLTEQDYPVEGKMFEPQPSIEDIIIEKIMAEKLMSVLKELTEQERFIITELFYRGKSERQLAKAIGVAQTTINYQKSILLKKLKKLIEK